jgi:ribosomal protein S18 acetylase RimI-like enzyme
MQIITRQMQTADLRDVDLCNDPFMIESHLALDVHAGNISYTAVPVEPYEKKYPLENVDYGTYVGNPDKAVFFAYADEELAGQIRIYRNWNRFAYIDDIAVKTAFRRQGVARALINEAIDWARRGGYPGLMLETQNNNVLACRLYESCGFQLGGFDRYLYQATMPGTEEIALYWYLLFEND